MRILSNSTTNTTIIKRIMSSSTTAATTKSGSSNFLSRLYTFPLRHPLIFGVGISCVKTSFSDLLVQKVVEKREKIDWKRNIAFGCFGFFYLGCVQYGLYVTVFGRMFPNAAKFAAKPISQKFKDTKGMFQLIAQVFLDQCVHHPFMYFPAFYCTKELVMSSREKPPNFTRVLTEYFGTNMMDDLLACWKVWVPAMILNFSFMPMFARIPFVAGVSLVWTMILSSMRGGDVIHEGDIAGGELTGATLTLVKESLATNTAGSSVFQSPVDLDKNMSHFTISASGPDKIGFVALLSRFIANHGGNVTHSKQVRLGTDFIVLMHVAVPFEERQMLMKNLKQNKELKPLQIRTNMLQRRNTKDYIKPLHGLRIHSVGEDRPGILASISEMVAEKNMSIENVTTEIVMGNNGRRNFVLTMDCTTTATENRNWWDRDYLLETTKEFTRLKEDLKLDTMDVRIVQQHQQQQ